MGAGASARLANQHPAFSQSLPARLPSPRPLPLTCATAMPCFAANASAADLAKAALSPAGRQAGGWHRVGQEGTANVAGGDCLAVACRRLGGWEAGEGGRPGTTGWHPVQAGSTSRQAGRPAGRRRRPAGS